MLVVDRKDSYVKDALQPSFSKTTASPIGTYQRNTIAQASE